MRIATANVVACISTNLTGRSQLSHILYLMALAANGSPFISRDKFDGKRGDDDG